ncbi:MAG: hypothetical protein Q4C85_07185 [Actinomyces sp.]|uniref:hypothetical protein n=1 Tax=Actinomyces sp. TaxID=29317 RepID=UPI0026DCDED6|nr:hypothetical protein [Actinomyces sp.]MDO4243526.1 hypothetical protein [Actinomyces sp.]
MSNTNPLVRTRRALAVRRAPLAALALAVTLVLAIGTSVVLNRADHGGAASPETVEATTRPVTAAASPAQEAAPASGGTSTLTWACASACTLEFTATGPEGQPVDLTATTDGVLTDATARNDGQSVTLTVTGSGSFQAVADGATSLTVAEAAQ